METGKRCRKPKPTVEVDGKWKMRSTMYTIRILRTQVSPSLVAILHPEDLVSRRILSIQAGDP